MSNKGRAQGPALKILFWTLMWLAAVLLGGVIASLAGSAIVNIGIALIILWAAFSAFVLFFFRDPEPDVPTVANVIVAPCHGKVDVIDDIEENDFMGGGCRRISVFLSIFDVHVQNAPVSGEVGFVKHTPGEFFNAMHPEFAARNENVLFGFNSSEAPDEKIGLRVIAGMIARRIVPWVKEGDKVNRGERICLIQFGSRCDILLPNSAKIKVEIGEKIVGGETVIAVRD
ncbi:MAG: phosphatidylserine decarboxylase [Verrucomicrobia bacterium]|nr:phosphatidylserine decarboxylase [Verrucomicrobiota bacterium]MCF7708639.1 phosphatidylserine decarboxylase [Verrucomicrobiota bacterium]